MSMKKRLTSQSAEGKVGDDPSLQGPVNKKRKSTLHYDPAVICQHLYDAVWNHKTGDGRFICEAFIQVPKKRTEPEYYNVVSNAIDMVKIQSKLKSEEYDDIDQLTADIELMVSNALTYYEKSSQEYMDACKLLVLFTETKVRMLEEVSRGDVDIATTGDGAEGGSKIRTGSGDDQVKPDQSSKKVYPYGISGYLVFARESRIDIRNMNPDMSFGSISKVIGERWRNLSKEEKEQYSEKARKISEETTETKEAADRTLSQSLSNAQTMYPNIKSSKKGHPSGYLVFAEECRNKIRNKKPDISFAAMGKAVGKRWQNLPKEEKEKYTEKAKKISEETTKIQEEADRALQPPGQFPPGQVPPQQMRGHLSGYILFAGECRKDIRNMNPDISFGELGRAVGQKWRNLPKEEKEKYAEKAKNISEDMTAKQEATYRSLNKSLNKAQTLCPKQTPGQFPPRQVPPQQMECKMPSQKKRASQSAEGKVDDDPSLQGPVSKKNKEVTVHYDEIKKGNRSGYIVFFSEYRKYIRNVYPGISFGDIGKGAGEKWRNLSKEEKEKYAEEAVTRR